MKAVVFDTHGALDAMQHRDAPDPVPGPRDCLIRVRAVAPNPYVASTYADSFAMQTGRYVVKPEDLPLYEVTLDDQGNQIVVSLQAGAPNGSKLCKILPDIL